MVRSWNHLKGESLAGRKSLYIHLPVARGAAETQLAGKNSKIGAKTSSKSKTASAAHPSRSAAVRSSAVHPSVQHHKVKQGETLYSIANSYKTTVQALKHDNRNIASLRPGMILVIHESR